MMRKSKQNSKSNKNDLFIEAAWEKEVEARAKAFYEGNIKTISYSKIKKEIRLKFNL